MNHNLSTVPDVSPRRLSDDDDDKGGWTTVTYHRKRKKTQKPYKIPKVQQQQHDLNIHENKEDVVLNEFAVVSDKKGKLHYESMCPEKIKGNVIRKVQDAKHELLKSAWTVDHLGALIKLVNCGASNIHSLNKSTGLHTFQAERNCDVDDSGTKVNSDSPCALFCLGLGSLQHSKAAQYQLALASIIQDNIAPHPAIIYDPVMTDIDTEVAATFGLATSSDTVMLQDSASLPDTYKILYYMPHCDLEVYDMVLTSLWSPKLLTRLFIIGNRFSFYSTRFQHGSPQKHQKGGIGTADGLGGRDSKEHVSTETNHQPQYENYHVKQSLNFVEERPGMDANKSPFFRAFNDMAIHCFNKDQVLKFFYQNN